MTTGWIVGRKPTMAELTPVFVRDGFVIYGGLFLVSWRGKVWIEKFNMPPRPGGDSYYDGYWIDGLVPDAWMPLPAPYCAGT